jgi:ribosomal-protein-alanine N-acetyltransferase
LLKSLTKIEIYPLSITEINSVLEIQRNSGLSFWSFEDYVSQVNSFGCFNFVAFNKRETIGFLISRPIMVKPSIDNVGNELEIFNLAIKTEHQNLGIGTSLLNKIITECLDRMIFSIWLEVRESNDKAQKFYNKHDFEVVYKRKNYYQNPLEDALVMHLNLINTWRVKLDSANQSKLT